MYRPNLAGLDYLYCTVIGTDFGGTGTGTNTI